MRNIIFLDTTLRDGEQAAGFALPFSGRILMAEKLAESGIDILEAGFPLSSPAECRSCAEIISALAGTPTVLSLMARGRAEEIRDTAALLKKGNSLLHVSFPSSFGHIRNKLNLAPGKLLERAKELVTYACGLVPAVECGAEDATRSDFDFLCDYCETVIAAGARVVNIADTLGVAAPEEISELVGGLLKRVGGFADGSARLSIHCHNDRGLAVANTLAAVRAGAAQVETTLCGVGDRAGNAAGEAVLANLAAHPELYRGKSKISMERLLECALHFCRLSGCPPPAGHPFLGNRIHAHASGIHQDGIRKFRGAYGGESEADRLVPERIVLSRHSGASGVMLLAESCHLPIDPRAAARILGDVKSRNLPSLGFTEFLRLYYKNSGPRPFPDTLFDIKDVFGGFEDRHCNVTVLRSNGESFPGKGSDMLSAVLDAVVRMSGRNLIPRRVEMRMMDGVCRCYMEVFVAWEPPFAVERIGTEPARLTAQCLLDALNFHLVKELHA